MRRTSRAISLSYVRARNIIQAEPKTTPGLVERLAATIEQTLENRN